jgi:hypothetical protein
MRREEPRRRSMMSSLHIHSQANRACASIKDQLVTPRISYSHNPFQHITIVITTEILGLRREEILDFSAESTLKSGICFGILGEVFLGLLNRTFLILK